MFKLSHYNAKTKLQYLLAIIALALITYLYIKKQINSTPTKYHFLHFGTVIQLTIAADSPALSNSSLAQIDSLLEKLHYKWHPWRDGELKELNKNLSTQKPFRTNEEVAYYIKLSQKLYTKTDGYFNPAIGKLVQLWGFHNDNPHNQYTNATNMSSRGLTAGSRAKLIAQIKQELPTPNSIIFTDKNTIQNINPYLELDFSGFIKADAALQIKQILVKNNIHNAIINIGGDLYVMGKKAKYQPWAIAIKNQNKPIVIELNSNEAIATSGIDARNYIEKSKNKNKLRHHIINPKTGEPADGFDSVTVIHHDPFIADAAATALLIAGQKNYKNILELLNIKKYILIKDDNILQSTEV